MKLNEKFDIFTSRSKAYDQHSKGNVAFISNGFDMNGLVGFVTPLKGERVFEKKGICISAFCEATVQKPPFLPRGNGGSGLTVLIPKSEMSDDELFIYAAVINTHRWRFSFGRMVIKDRILSLEIAPISAEIRKISAIAILKSLFAKSSKDLT